MTYSPLCTRTIQTARWNGFQRIRIRPHDPTIFIVHHAAGTAQGAINRAQNPSQELSFNYTIHEVTGEIIGGISEDFGAWTSSSPKADSIAITAEVGNIGGRAPGKNDYHSDSWRISSNAFHALARLIADWARRYGRKINRSTVIGHREVIGKFGQGVITACPGGWLWTRMGELIAQANKYLKSGSGSGSTEEDTLSAEAEERIKKYIDARTRSAAGSQAQIVKSSGHWLDIGIGRCGIWGKDLPFLRSAIISLNWQRRDGAGHKGQSDVAYATGGPSPYAYSILEEYREAARTGGRIHGGSVHERKEREKAAAAGGASGGSAAMSSPLEIIKAETSRMNLSEADVDAMFEGYDDDAPDAVEVELTEEDVKIAIADMAVQQD